MTDCLTTHDHDRDPNPATRRAAQLEAMRAASAALTSELDLNVVLQHVVDLSRELVNARYAALGVLNAEGTEIEQFITAGIPREMRARIGPFPRGHGLLGAIIKEKRAIRVDNIAADPRSSGDPGHHPHMHTFLGVPIVSRGRVFGNLYLTDKQAVGMEGGGNGGESTSLGQWGSGDVGAVTTSRSKQQAADSGKSRSTQHAAEPPPFTQEDQETLELFAMQAAIAIEHALLHRQSEALAIAKERERIAMDLHDGIIQSIYAIGLTLDDGRFYLAQDPARTRERIDRAIVDLNDVIGDLRNYIMDLEPARFSEQDMTTGLADLARRLRADSFLSINTDVSPQAAEALSHEQTRALLHIAKEALANARKHARATRIDIRLRLDNDRVRLVIEDDGVGMDAVGMDAAASEPEQGPGKGLANMDQRADQLFGTLAIDSGIGRGTQVTVTVPVRSDNA